MESPRNIVLWVAALAVVLAFVVGCPSKRAPDLGAPSIGDAGASGSRGGGDVGAGPADAELERGDGSGSAPGSASPGSEARDELRASARWVLRPVIWFSGFAAAGAFVASFLFPVVPRKAAAAAAGAFAGALALQYAVTRYGVVFAEVSVWVGAVLVVVSVSPFVVGLVHSRIRQVGAKLAVEGDTRAGVALMAAADRRVNDKRKELAAGLARVERAKQVADGEADRGDVRGTIEREARRIDGVVDVLNAVGVRAPLFRSRARRV